MTGQELVISEKARLRFTDVVRAIHDCPPENETCIVLYFIAFTLEADLEWPTCLLCKRCLVEPHVWHFPLAPMFQLLCAPCLVAHADPPITYMAFGSEEYCRKTWLITELASRQEMRPFPADAPAKRVYTWANGNLFEKVKAVYSVEDIAGRFTDLQPAGPRKLKGCCPLHKESTPSFHIWTDTQTWRCFGACAMGGDVIRLTRELMNKGLMT